MKNRRTWPALPLVLLLAALLLAGCASSGKKAQSHTKGYNTDENLAVFEASGLFEMAKGYYETCRDSHYLFFSIDSDTEYYIDRSAPPTTPMEPFVAVVVREGDEGEPVWSVCGGSGEEMDLDGARTLAVCAISRRGANYTGTISAGFSTVTDTFHGYTEDATILYLDVASGKCVMTGEVKGRDLPDRASGVPQYTLNDSELVDRIRTDLVLPFELSEDGEITDGKLDGDLNGYVFPESVKRITKLEVGEGVSGLTLPASVEFIAEGAIPKKMSSRENPWGLDVPVVLTVEPGSYAETFAREGGYVYRREDRKDDQYVWLAGCECTFFRMKNYACPLRPDGDLADFVTLRKPYGSEADAAPDEYYVLVVEEGSPAADYAQAHQYPYRYPSAAPDEAATRGPWDRPNDDPEEDTVRFCLDDLEWVTRSGVVCFPEGFADSEAIRAWIAEDRRVVPLFASEADRQRFGAADMEAWVGDFDVAEQVKVTEDGLSWRLVRSFSEEKLLAVTVPEGYVQSGEKLDNYTLLNDLGYDANRNGWPVCIVQPGSWAAETAPVSIEAGTTVLRMRRDNRDRNSYYVNDYVCGLVTQVVDAYFGYGEDDPVRKLLDHGIRALYTQSPLQATIDDTYAVPFAMLDRPDRLILKSSWIHWHINNGALLEGVSALRIGENVSLNDEAERTWILERARQDEPFRLEVVEGTDAEAFARENDIPYELWDPQSEDITGEPLEQ